MARFSLPYGKEQLPAEIPDGRLQAVLRGKLQDYRPPMDQEELVGAALARPIGAPPLSELARGKNKVIILASDHTRPVPSKLILPPMLAEIRRGNPEADITILIATGCHRETTKEELTQKLGPEIMAAEKIVVHDCDDEPNLVSLGDLPSGARLQLNRLAVECDLLCAEGFIEPHFFAGFSGGRKSVMPGVAARETVLVNHCAAFVDSDRARTGILEGNPIHRDMVYAARRANLAFIVNVVINEQKEVIHAVAGDCEAAHLEGAAFLTELCRVERTSADIVIATNGGYPLDQNIYQAVKGMSTAEAVVRPGGVIIMAAKSVDGHGAEHFYRAMSQADDLGRLYADILATPAEQTAVDQWQSQVLSRILLHCSVIYVSDLDDELVSAMHLIPAHSITEAIDKADTLLGRTDGKIVLIPDGVGVIVG